MSDINDLNGLREPDPIEWDSYDPGRTGGGSFVLPPKGAYTLLFTGEPKRVPHKEGYLQYELTPITVIDPGKPWDGYQFNYSKVNTKQWSGRNASSIGDYLLSVGGEAALTVDGRYPTSNDDYINVVEGLVNPQFRAFLDQRAWCKTCNNGKGRAWKGMASIPEDADGNKVTRFNCPSCSTEGNPVTVFVNVQISSFIPAEGGVK